MFGFSVFVLLTFMQNSECQSQILWFTNPNSSLTRCTFLYSLFCFICRKFELFSVVIVCAVQ